MRKKIFAKILSQSRIGTGIYDIRLEADEIAREAKPGQFVAVYAKDGSRLLPRPVSICEVRGEMLRLVYRVVGEGTREFASYRAGETLAVMGPLGNGFPLEKKKAFLIGGGIGIPPMLELAKHLDCEKQILLGYRDEVFLHSEFEAYGQVYLATEDGSAGIKGTVMDAIRENGLEADVIYACGPKPMLRAVKAYAETNHITAWISMEERMACGIGACLACVCESKDRDEYSHVHNKRVCKDGPVFDAREVELG
ncbi:MAG: dihydroorotate dehydrogenase electron transfer subunit [Lachnospiraceae bacterium]|nr:dihydroorotate dehydrogenase electron transfer subunit [Lachnospiraceae bacterium]